MYVYVSSHHTDIKRAYPDPFHNRAQKINTRLSHTHISYSQIGEKLAIRHNIFIHFLIFAHGVLFICKILFWEPPVEPRQGLVPKKLRSFSTPGKNKLFSEKNLNVCVIKQARGPVKRTAALFISKSSRASCRVKKNAEWKKLYASFSPYKFAHKNTRII